MLFKYTKDDLVDLELGLERSIKSKIGSNGEFIDYQESPKCPDYKKIFSHSVDVAADRRNEETFPPQIVSEVSSGIGYGIGSIVEMERFRDFVHEINEAILSGEVILEEDII